MSLTALVLGWLGLAVMLVGAVWAPLAARHDTQPTAGWERVLVGALRLSLFVQALALVVQGIAAQRAKGSYWSWSQGECWQLAAWLATAMLAVWISRLGWPVRRR